ncbi:MAG: hypothetical protein R3A80_11935 [Bdellovibrionota bacterium]
MKTRVHLSLLVLCSSFFLSDLYAFQNMDCENSDSPFLIEIGYDTATVLNKKTFEVEKVLVQVSSAQASSVSYESDGGDWTLVLSKNKRRAILQVGDSDERVPFACPDMGE